MPEPKTEARSLESQSNTLTMRPSFLSHYVALGKSLNLLLCQFLQTKGDDNQPYFVKNVFRPRGEKDNIKSEHY